MSLEKEAYSALLTRLAPLLKHLTKLRNIGKAADVAEAGIKGARGAKGLSRSGTGFLGTYRSAISQVKNFGYRGVAKWGKNSWNVGPRASSRVNNLSKALRANRLAARQKGSITGAPIRFLQKGVGEIAYATRNPGRFFKDYARHINTKTVSVAKHTKGSNPRLYERGGRTYFKPKIGKERLVQGFTSKGDAIIKRNVGGKALTFGLSGPGLGAQELLFKTDAHGNPVSKKKRTGKAIKETAFWTAAPKFTGTALVGKLLYDSGKVLTNFNKQASLKDLGFKKSNQINE